MKTRRILILRTDSKEGCECVYQPGCHVEDSCACCHVGQNYDTLVEKLAIARFERERPGSRGEAPIEDVWEDLKDTYLEEAKRDIDILLGD